MSHKGKIAETRPADRSRLGEFLRQYGRLLAAFTALGASPFLTNLVVRISPPWPEEVVTSALACVVNTVLLVLIYVRIAAPRPAVYQWAIKWLAITFTASLVVFVFFKSFFCYNAPDWRYQVSGGLILRPEIVKFLSNEPGLAVQRLLEEARYDAYQVWLPWTVDLVRVVILLVWLVLFASVTGVVAVGLRWDERNKAGTRPVSR
jgi:hypothetical protein